MENRKIKVTAVKGEDLHEFCKLVSKPYEEYGRNERRLLKGECHIAFDQVPVDIDNNEYNVGVCVSAMLNHNTKVGVLMTFIEHLDFNPEECRTLVMAVTEYALDQLRK